MTRETREIFCFSGERMACSCRLFDHGGIAMDDRIHLGHDAIDVRETRCLPRCRFCEFGNDAVEFTDLAYYAPQRSAGLSDEIDARRDLQDRRSIAPIAVTAC